MEELIAILNEIKYELQDMNGKLDEIKGAGIYDSISDVNEKLDRVADALVNIELNQ